MLLTWKVYGVTIFYGILRQKPVRSIGLYLYSIKQRIFKFVFCGLLVSWAICKVFSFSKVAMNFDHFIKAVIATEFDSFLLERVKACIRSAIACLNCFGFLNDYLRLPKNSLSRLCDIFICFKQQRSFIYCSFTFYGAKAQGFQTFL